MNTLISTHPIDIAYCIWQRDDKQHTKTCVWDFTLPGGAGIANPKTLLTPDGVATEVSDETLEKLMTIGSFKADVDAGYVKVLKGQKARSVDANEEAAKDMNTEGSGKQITDAELIKDGAVMNDDGSIDVTKGGKNAAIEHSRQGEKAKRDVSVRRGGRSSKR